MGSPPLAEASGPEYLKRNVSKWKCCRAIAWPNPAEHLPLTAQQLQIYIPVITPFVSPSSPLIDNHPRFLVGANLRSSANPSEAVGDAEESEKRFYDFLHVYSIFPFPPPLFLHSHSFTNDFHSAFVNVTQNSSTRRRGNCSRTTGIDGTSPESHYSCRGGRDRRSRRPRRLRRGRRPTRQGLIILRGEKLAFFSALSNES